MESCMKLVIACAKVNIESKHRTRVCLRPKDDSLHHVASSLPTSRLLRSPVCRYKMTVDYSENYMMNTFIHNVIWLDFV